METTVTDIWSQLAVSLRKKINPQSFETWILPTKPLDFSNETLTIEVPNIFFKDWLNEHYLNLFYETSEQIFGKKFGFLFIIAHHEQSSTVTAAKPAPLVVTRDFHLNPKYTFESFVVGQSNRFSHAACMAVAESPAKAYNPLFIYGGVGLGKTHLMQAVGQYIISHNNSLRLTYISSEKFTTELINAIQHRTTLRFREKYRNVDILLIDDIHFIAGKESTQEEFFHTFNALYDAHKQILITSDRHPKDISNLEERLVSRFEWGLLTDIQPPDLETRIAILKKKAEREVVVVPDEVIFFIADRIKSNIRELEGALIRVVAYTLLTNSQISVGLARDILKDSISFSSKNVTIDHIQKKVSSFFDLRLSDMKTKGRSRAVAFPRQIAMYLARTMTNHSLPEIGEFFGGRDHTTVLHAVEKIKRSVDKDQELNNLLIKLKELIYQE
ncbi:MAG: chromosomal replication initiator protein DnaA [Candidatus Omnitrophota bacterium]